ncbi:MAG: hypothetical protein ACT4NU_12050 [Chromatiales bacterium]
MAYYQFDSDSSDVSTRVESAANITMSWLVRLAGLALLVVGLWTAITIILEAWTIYTNPRSQRVEAFARAIEDATHLDAMLTPKRAVPPTPGAGATGDVGSDRSASARPTGPTDELRMSYFIAWAILLMMLLLVGRLSIAAIRTGGELALYDVQIRRFARELIREVARERQRG